MFRKMNFLGMLLVGVACDGGGGANVTSSDIRIDGAGDSEQSIESVGVQMCAADRNNVYVVWHDDRNGNQDIWLNYSLDGGRSWATSPVKVNNSTANAVSPTITCEDNRVFVAWEDERNGELENHNIYYNYSTNAGQTWQSEDRMLDDDEDGRTMSLAPQIKVWNEKVFVVWFDSVNGAYDIFLASSDDLGNSFSEPVRVDSDKAGEAYSAYPQLVIGETGDIFVVWEDSRDELSDIYFAYSRDFGASFSSDIRLDGGDAAGASDSFSPQIATQNGEVYVVWHDSRHGENRNIYMNWSQDGGGTWEGSAVRVESSAEGFSDSIYPRLVAYNGSAHVAWQSATEKTGYDVYYRKFTAGGFDAEESMRLDQGTGAGYANSLRPQIAMGENGLLVAWEDRRDDVGGVGYDDLYYNYSLDEGAIFENDDLRVDNVDKGSKYADDMVLAIQNQRLLSVWRDGRRGNSDIFFHGMKVGKEAEYLEIQK